MSKSKKLIVGNWKMNPKTLAKAQTTFLLISKKVTKIASPKVQVVICPPSIFIPKIISKKVLLGAQNVFQEAEGAYTGEISASMLDDAGVSFVIVGHSERRARGETNEIVAQKVKAALSFGITPILCIGEATRDDSGEYHAFLKKQLTESLSLIPKTWIPKVVIAYEPVWAIGKNAIREATPEESEEMAIFIKKILSDLSGDAHKKTRILYGGSATVNNAEAFLSKGGVDGLLVGRDSLNPENFTEIIAIAKRV